MLKAIVTPSLEAVRTIRYATSFRAPVGAVSTTVNHEASEEEHKEARTWLASFNINAIPKKACEVTFSRSSGPGGQNVNKVNSKATLRLHTKDLLPLVPKILHPQIEGSRYYAESSKSLVIQGDGSRKRTDNEQECFKKLQALIVDAGKNTVKGETSPQQAEKVKNL